MCYKKYLLIDAASIVGGEKYIMEMISGTDKML